MSAEENKALMRRVMEEIFNEGNLDLVDELFAPDYVDHDPNMPEDVRGPEGFKEFVSAYRASCADLHIEVEDQVAEGEKVTTCWTATCTHDGDLWGIPPTGNRVRVAGMEISGIVGGKVAETWGNYDVMGLMKQIGAIPSPEQPEEASPA